MTGDELRAALKRLDYSIAEAARRMHVHYTTLWHQADRGARLIDGPYAATVECWLERAKLG